MVTLYRDEQVNTISLSLNIPKLWVKGIITSYVDYLLNKIDCGESVKFLNICNIRVNHKPSQTHETLAYTATELSAACNYSSVVVGRVLSMFEESIIEDITKGFSYNIRGLVTIKMDHNAIRITKSSVYNGLDVRVMTLGSFRRKVGALC